MTDSLLQPTWLDAQGRREGRYVIGPLLGHGAMGDVYEAWDIVLARPVALKILQHLEPAAMIRFMHEAQLHARLDSPNICRIYDVDATGGTPRIAMQLIRGPTLEDAAKDLRLDELVAILIQVADAVHVAHQVNLIHRDIKPSNILLQWSEHSGWMPYICDFGLAMALDGPAVTQPLAMTGTPAYMAPEQVRGDRSLVGPPTDVYGIGSTLYFTLTGRPPCVSTTTAEMLRVKRECGFPSPRSLEPDLPPILEGILLKCLEPLPQDRYATAAELADELRQFQQTVCAPDSPEPGLPGRMRTWVRGRRSLLALLVGFACLAGTLPAVASYIKRQRARQGELVQTIALEAATFEQAIRNERMLPVHDLRPADASTRQRMAALPMKLEGLGRASEGPLWLALGRANFLLDNPGAAKEALTRAWNLGYRTPDGAFLLAQIHGDEARAETLEAAFLGLPPPAEAAANLALAQDGFLQARLQTSHPREYLEALEAYYAGDYPQAAEDARQGLQANPWHLESAILGSQCLALQARERRDAGDADRAETLYQEALTLARSAMDKAPSEPRLRHAACVASLGLAAGALESGDLPLATLQELDQQTAQLLQLNPDNQDAQSDWLQVRTLAAMRLAALGQDPREELDRALHFYWTRTREPRGVELRMDHLTLYWLQAERDFAQREDPAPSLTEAMKDLGHTTTRFRDFQGDLLNFKARFEMARGLDPRPTLAATLARFEPPALQQNAYRLCEIAGKAWLLRADWESQHGIDPMESIRRAQPLLQRALESRPTSAAAHALQGQSQVLEASCSPDNRKELLARASEHLRWSLRLNRTDQETARLQRVLAHAGS